MTAFLAARDSRWAWVRRTLLPLALLGLLSSCVPRKEAEHPDGGDKTSSDGPAAAVDRHAAVDFPPAPKTCGELRSCIYACGDSAACLSHCMTTAPAAAVKVNATVDACSKQACPQGDVLCRCDAECFFPGPCVDALGQCTEGASDQFCDIQCH